MTELERLLERLAREGPYGIWRRLAPRRELDAFELLTRDADEAWDIRYPDEADRLDALVGTTVALLRAREGFPDPDTDEARVYPRGARFRVVGRIRGNLFVSTADLPCPLMVKPEWVRPVAPDPTPAEILERAMNTYSARASAPAE